jgi:APA family basic amino acid/polyamine antiporter
VTQAAPPLSDTAAATRPNSEFVQAITLTDATMLVAGSMIGSGIFITSAAMARSVGSPMWLLIAWVLTGVITLLGALSYGELAAMFPRAGGQYVFLRESMGPLMGFLYGWTLFLVIQTGTIAAVAVAFGRFLGVLWPAIGPDRYAWFPQANFCASLLGCTDSANAIQLGLSPQRLVALASIAVLTWINLRGVREGKLVQTSLTLIKTSALALLIILGLTVGRNATAIAANFGRNFGGGVDVTGAFIVAFGAALVGSLFSSDAWNNVTFAAAEVQNPKRNLPLALLFGTGLVSFLYVMANVAYLNVLPMSGAQDGATAIARGVSHATQDRVATAALEVILAGARVYYAMARDRLFFRRVGTLNHRRVPAAGLIVQSIWVALLCLTGSYNQLLNYVIFAALVFYALTTIGLFILRAKRPDVERPYRTVGYPALPALYIVLTTVVMLLILISPSTRQDAFLGLAIVILGIPVYFLWRTVEGPGEDGAAVR